MSSPAREVFLFWLDENVEDFKTVEVLLRSIFVRIFMFTDPQSFLSELELIDGSKVSLSVLISGKFGENLVRENLEPMEKINSIFVFCHDVNKHNRWAQSCNKVRCVLSNFDQIVQRMRFESEKKTKSKEETTDSDVAEKNSEIFSCDEHCFDQLAAELVAEKTETDFDERKSTEEIFQENLQNFDFFADETEKIYEKRKFLRRFARRISANFRSEKKFFLAAKIDEEFFDALKKSVGKKIVSNKFLVVFVSEEDALNSVRKEAKSDEYRLVVFEMFFDDESFPSRPIATISDKTGLVFLATPFRLTKIEFRDEIFFLSLRRTFRDEIFRFFFDQMTKIRDFRRTAGQILFLKGNFERALKFLQSTGNVHDLTEIFLRTAATDKLVELLPKLDEPNDRSQLLLGFSLLLLPSEEEKLRGRSVLRKLSLESNEPIVRAQTHLGLGFFALVFVKDIRDAKDYFSTSFQLCNRILPANHPLISKTLIGLAHCFYAEKDFQQAKIHFRNALEIQKNSLPDNHPYFGATLAGLARCALVEHKKSDAEEFLQTALEILRRTFTENAEENPQIRATIKDLHRIQQGEELQTRKILLDYI